MAGICRGGQFLNVMCGGKMWQHIDGHAIHGTHSTLDLITKERFEVTSTHHQMMIPGPEAVIIGVARETKWKETMGPSGPLKIFNTSDDDYEILWYPNYNVFCFQPHPEFLGRNDLRQRYMEYLEFYLMTDRAKKENIA
ncbi:MAG: gamma-glutamyl-gamma-aminobutyrate hydrolase family protein [Candidatus Thorarchaeota archaeon]